MDLLNELAELALASRLRRLSDRLMKDVADVYQTVGVDFYPRWFTVFQALERYGPLGVTEVADLLGVSHTQINQVATAMKASGLVTRAKDPADERRSLIQLTKKGRQTGGRLDHVWQGLRTSTADLETEAGSDLLDTISKIERCLAQKSMGNRLRAELGMGEVNPVQIVDYRPAYKKHFAMLNKEWLETLFHVETHDQRFLDDPNGTIIRRGGVILFAKFEEQIVGTCALLKRSDNAMELSKMAVTKAFRGRGIGRQLAEEALNRARNLGATRIVLSTSLSLKAAGSLYKSLGFQVIDYGPAQETPLERPSVSMSLELPPADNRRNQ